MKIWYYDEITKELIGVGEALENPEHKGDYMIPMFATTLEPLPYKDGYVVIFEDEWKYKKINQESIQKDNNFEKTPKQIFYTLINSPIEYINGLKYRPIWKDKLTMLYYQMFDDETVKVYDITKTNENSQNMTKQELKELIIFLRDRYEYYYQKMINNQ